MSHFVGEQRVLPGHRRHRVRGARVEEPAELQVLRSRQARPREDHARPPAVRRGLLAQLLRDRVRSVRAGHAGLPLGLGGQRRWIAPGRNWTRPSSSSPSSACRSTASTIATWRRRAPPSAESERNLQALVALAKERQQATGVKLLWGTANLFSDPRYMNGAATNPDFRVRHPRGGPGQGGHRRHDRARRARLRVLGRTRRLLVPAQHRHEARTGAPGPLPGAWPATTAARSASRAPSSSNRSRWSRRSTSTTSTPRR